MNDETAEPLMSIQLAFSKLSDRLWARAFNVGPLGADGRRRAQSNVRKMCSSDLRVSLKCEKKKNAAVPHSIYQLFVSIECVPGRCARARVCVCAHSRQRQQNHWKKLVSIHFSKF